MKENSIEKKLENIQDIDLITLLRQFKKEGLENFIVLRKSNFDEILSDYKRVLKENEELKDRIREHTMLISPYYVKENYIPKTKIEEILEKTDLEIKKLLESE